VEGFIDSLSNLTVQKIETLGKANFECMYRHGIRWINVIVLEPEHDLFLKEPLAHFSPLNSNRVIRLKHMKRLITHIFHCFMERQHTRKALSKFLDVFRSRDENLISIYSWDCKRFETILSSTYG
jgi:hypothetical protein